MGLTVFELYISRSVFSEQLVAEYGQSPDNAVYLRSQRRNRIDSFASVVRRKYQNFIQVIGKSNIDTKKRVETNNYYTNSDLF